MNLISRKRQNQLKKNAKISVADFCCRLADFLISNFIEIVFIQPYTLINFDISKKIGNGNTCGNKIGNTIKLDNTYSNYYLLPMLPIIYY